MTDNLSPTQRTIYDSLPATAVEIATEMAYSTTSTVYDHIKAIRGKGYEIAQNADNEYVVIETADDGDGVLNVSAPNRIPSKTKASITRKAKNHLAELEVEVKAAREQTGPCIADGGSLVLDGDMDVVIPCFDDHFGDIEKDERDREIFNSDILASRIRRKFDLALDAIEVRVEMGMDITRIIVILGGDHVTNEAIFEQQSWGVEDPIDVQLNKASNTYWDELERLSTLFPSSEILVVCNHGNHGEFRVGGQSKGANADDFMYDRLESMAVVGNLENVTFWRSDRSDAVSFPIRLSKPVAEYDNPLAVARDPNDEGYVGFVAHGQNVSTHIGTKSPLSTWRGYKAQTGFDVAYRGHYHERRVEPVNGAPVYEIPSLKDGGEYEMSLGIVPGRPMGFIQGITDDGLPSFEDYIHF